MNELISKTEVIDDLKKDIEESNNWLVISIYLAITVRIMSYKNIDAVEVVRCKNCVNWEKDWSVDLYGSHYCPCMDTRTMEDDYCSYGERRTNEQSV